MVSEDELKPWDKQPTDTIKSYNAFRVYLNMAPHERSLRKAADRFYGVSKWSKQRQFLSWSAKHNWVERVLAYDREQERIYQQEQRMAIRKMNERQAAIGADLQMRAFNIIKLDNLETPEGADLTLNERAQRMEVGRRLMEAGMKVERVSRGEPDQIIEQTGTTKHEVNISESVKEYEKALQELEEPD
ncbi:hypothetical protein B6U67_04500 [Methanosarcinales archaeon ex4484_138]|nr:MAG: hypothetical protein B6U67_04500 [Methanosarcinales archaeon ex4484_138]